MNEKKSIRMSYVFPIIAALILIIFDALAIRNGDGPHYAQYVLTDESDKFQVILNCILDLVISYIPANIFSVICFALMQQKMYGIPAGLNEDFIVLTFLLNIVYVCVYVYFLATGDLTREKAEFVFVTLFYCIYIWKKAIDSNYKYCSDTKDPDPANIENPVV